MSIPVVERKRFMVGDFEIIAQPIPYATHMLRYTVFHGGRRLGALVSVPSESDCRFLQNPPVVPPLKTYSVAYRPGRPKNGSKPPVAEGDKGLPPPPREDLPHGISLPDVHGGEDR